MNEQDRQAFRERFHRVILGAGYSEEAAQGILEEWLDKYLQDIPQFVKMLQEYENGSHDDD